MPLTDENDLYLLCPLVAVFSITAVAVLLPSGARLLVDGAVVVLLDHPLKSLEYGSKFSEFNAFSLDR